MQLSDECRELLASLSNEWRTKVSVALQALRRDPVNPAGGTAELGRVPIPDGPAWWIAEFPGFILITYVVREHAHWDNDVVAVKEIRLV